MSAPDNAIPLKEENPDWAGQLPGFHCPACNYSGMGEELLCTDDDDTLWCPMCRTSGWIWD